MPSTPLRALPYPSASALPDVPADMNLLATALDKDVFWLSGTFAGRPAAGTEGRIYRATDGSATTGYLFYDNGTVWRPLYYADGPFLALAGGSLTGDVNAQDHVLSRPELLDVAETTVVIAVSGASRTLDYTAGAIYDITLDQACTFTFSNPPATGKSGALLIYITQPATLRAVTWPASVKWPGGTAPTMVLSTVNVFSFETHDAGTTWRCTGYTLDIH